MPNEPNAVDADEAELSRRWRAESERYVSAINEYVRRGMTLGWDRAGADEQPTDTRGPMADAVLAAVRRANAAGRTDGLHDRFPRAHEPFGAMVDANGQALPKVLLLDDGRIVARVGAPYEQGRVVVIDDLEVRDLPAEVLTVGRSPSREFFAVARPGGVTVHRGWDRSAVAALRWPPGYEGGAADGVPTVTDLIPFDDGRRVLLVSPHGVFVLADGAAVQLLPVGDDPPAYGLSMEHAALSPDGRWIAAGHQSSMHHVFDADTYAAAGEVGPATSYPHRAAFSADGSVLALNSCHFYNGQTVGAPTWLLPGLTTEAYEPDERLVELQDGARVYAAVARGDEFVVGDAYGYLRAFDLAGNFRWQHHLGSTVGDIDVSRDGRRLVVTTYAGYLSILDLDTGTADPFVIGTATHRERRRWLFWKTEPAPLVW